MSNKTCEAKDPQTCRYHGRLIAMKRAASAGNVTAWLKLRAEVKKIEKSGWADTNPADSYRNQPANVVELTDITKVKELIDADAPLSTYFSAEAEFPSWTAGRYRKFAKKNNLEFTEEKTGSTSVFTFVAKDMNDLKKIYTMYEDADHRNMDMEEQAAFVKENTSK